MLNVCALTKIVSKIPDSSLIQLKKYTHLKCSLQILSFFKEIRASLSVSIVKLSLKDNFLNIFKLLESYICIFFFLILEAIKTTVVESKTSFVRESSVMYNALWEQFKMVNDRKTITFFKISQIHKLSHRELLY